MIQIRLFTVQYSDRPKLVLFPASEFFSVTDNTLPITNLESSFLLRLTLSHHSSSSTLLAACIFQQHASREQRRGHKSLLTIFRKTLLFTHAPEIRLSSSVSELRSRLTYFRSLLHIWSKILTPTHFVQFSHSRTQALPTHRSHNTSRSPTPGHRLFHHTIHPRFPLYTFNTSTTKSHTCTPTNTPQPTAKMVKWENDKNVYILGAALGALGTTISNEIIEAIRADWRMFFFSFYPLLYSSFTLPCSSPPHLISSHFIISSGRSSSLPLPPHPIPSQSKKLQTNNRLRNHTASEQLGETPTLRAVRDQIKKLSTTSSSSTTTTATKKSGTGVKKPRAAASAKGKGNAKGKGKKRAADDDDSDDAEKGDKEGDGDEDEEIMPAKKKQKKTAAVEKEVEDEDDDGEV
jgi:hypothetical protein